MPDVVDPHFKNRTVDHSDIANHSYHTDIVTNTYDSKLWLHSDFSFKVHNSSMAGGHDKSNSNQTSSNEYKKVLSFTSETK